MIKQLEIFVKCFYVWTEKIGLRALSLAFFSESDWIFILKTRSKVREKSFSTKSLQRFQESRDAELRRV